MIIERFENIKEKLFRLSGSAYGGKLKTLNSK